METYQVEIQIRKKGGLIPTDSDGNKVPSIKMEKSVNTLGEMESTLKRLYKDFEAITPEGAFINIEVYSPNHISGTWMNMASYYGNEERFCGVRKLDLISKKEIKPKKNLEENENKSRNDFDY